MPIIYILAVIVVIGLIAWGMQKVPMDATIRTILHVFIVIVLVLFLLSLFVNLGSIFNMRVGR